MAPFPERLKDAEIRLKRAAAEIRETLCSQSAGVPDPVTPEQLTEALSQFLTAAIRLDQQEGEAGPVTQADVSQIGDYGLAILNDLITWTTQQNLHGARSELEFITIAAADWVMRHKGRIRTLNPIVNALANLANRASEPEKLETLTDFMGNLINSSSDSIGSDIERASPDSPWRVLHLNRGIVATRTQNAELMERVFDELVTQLPDEAPQFFNEGMQQMQTLDYPPHVKEVISRYFDAWTRPTMH